IKKMLAFNPADRYSASQCLGHAWLKDHNRKKVDVNFSIKCLNNMKKFHAERKLQQAALTYIVNNLLTKEEKNELLDLFQAFDKNGDGVLTKEEIYEGYKSILG